MAIRVKMVPHVNDLQNHSSGIAQVVLNYFKYLPKYDIELVGKNVESYDLLAGHAAAVPNPDVHHSHGLLWTAEFRLDDYAWKTNADLVEGIRYAKAITVPSNWVAEPFRRDFRVQPYVVPHGVEWDKWQHSRKKEGYVLWAKNRTSDGLNARILNDFARAFPDVEFVTTFSTPDAPSNITAFNTAIPHEEMKIYIQAASVVIMTDRETWGILAAEAMAAGTAVLSVDSGAVPSFMPHGIAGYCYAPGNFEDAKNGLSYCLKYQDRLGYHGKSIAKNLTWDNSCNLIAAIYKSVVGMRENFNVGIVIPCYNNANTLNGAIESAVKQDYENIEQIVIVNDGSTDDNVQNIINSWVDRDSRISFLRQPNSGVSIARNNGYKFLDGDIHYVCFLDSDDRIEPRFISRLIEPFKLDRTLGITYTGVRVIHPNGQETVPWDWPNAAPGEARRGRKWPTVWNYDEQLNRENQIPTCCLIRREAIDRVGGYRSRYCPDGAGSEDAELFLRLGAYGWAAEYVKPKNEPALFVHTHGDGTVSGNSGYDEPDWTAWHPWVKDGGHPFVSHAAPKKYSHPVRSYERPGVSVIIPIGEGHEKKVIDALDSLEAQTFRYWEVIVYWDSPDPHLVPDILKVYPYVKILGGYGEIVGPGVARNKAIEESKAPFIAFLDSDDYYAPLFLEQCFEAFEQYGSIIYTDFISKMTAEQHKRYGGTIIKEHKRYGEVFVNDSFLDFDENKAIERPSGDRPYVWSGVTLFLPRMWHNKIGGFDEELNTWEDCDYLLRLAWEGYKFNRIQEPLWLYNFSSGHRRENSIGKEKDLIAYFQKKWDKKFDKVEV